MILIEFFPTFSVAQVVPLFHFINVSQVVKLLVVTLPQPSQQRADLTASKLPALKHCRSSVDKSAKKWVPTGSREKVYVSISGQEGRKLTAEGLAAK